MFSILIANFYRRLPAIGPDSNNEWLTFSVLLWAVGALGLIAECIPGAWMKKMCRKTAEKQFSCYHFRAHRVVMSCG
jgi:hypothetical protein